MRSMACTSSRMRNATAALKYAPADSPPMRIRSVPKSEPPRSSTARGDRDAVVGSGRPRKLGCFAVLDRYHDDIERPCEHLIRDVHHRGGTRDHPAAVEVQIDRAWHTVGADHPAGDSGDLDG